MRAKESQFSLSILLTFSLFNLSYSILDRPDFITLLAFKSSSDISSSLSSWSNSSDHCSWLGVTCNPSTHRVTKLVLNHLNLTGSIQTLTRLAQLRHLSLHHNRLNSPPNLASWPNLKHLYLSHNLFAGTFPAGVHRLRHLLRLDLSHNHFSGVIPIKQLAQLPHLLTLRLEFNSFAGSLTSDEWSSASIVDLNVSSNNLAGKIPNWLSKFPETSFAGNRDLCGKPLPSGCRNQPSASNRTVGSDAVQINVSGEKKNKNLSNRMVLLIITIDVAAVVSTIAIVVYCCYTRRYRYRYRERNREAKSCSTFNALTYGVERENEELVRFEGCKGFTKVEELLTASAEMLGKGCVGTTYKVVMDSGDVLVVKRVREWMGKRREINGFLRELGGLRHPNIVSLRACYSSKDEMLLVYDFLPNGTLFSLLHGDRGPGRIPLDWTTRLKLASGSAQGLAFLHSYNKSKLFHGHLTSSNIIVDHSGNACISDVGLHQLLPAPSSSNNAYKAPELLVNSTGNSKFLQRCDVYSFGVVLLETLTGKMATSEGEASLVTWVTRVVREEWTWEVFDLELLRYKEMEEEMMALLQVALLCLAPLSGDRPKMSAVYVMIENIRTKGGKSRSPSDSSPSLSESTTPNFTSA